LAAAASGLPKKNEGVVETVVDRTRLDRGFPALDGGLQLPHRTMSGAGPNSDFGSL
jgi:hypothetical protein